MLDGPAMVAALEACGISHVVWIPDSDLGRWDEALARGTSVRLIRVCREGEAFAVAAGLLLGGKRPMVVIQCTGLFEAGDALRNIVHDMRLPLLVLVGVRNWLAYQAGQTADTCPRFIEPIVRAWDLESSWLDERDPAASLAFAQARSQASGQAIIVLYAE